MILNFESHIQITCSIETPVFLRFSEENNAYVFPGLLYAGIFRMRSSGYFYNIQIFHCNIYNVKLFLLCNGKRSIFVYYTYRLSLESQQHK